MAAYAKAIMAGIVAFLGGLYQALLDNHVTPNEWVTIVMATVAAVGLVFGVPNTVGSTTKTPPSQ